MDTLHNSTAENAVLNPSVAAYSYQLLMGVATQTNTPQHNQAHWIIELGGVYSLLLKELTRSETQFFPNSYTRSVFVFDNYQLPHLLYVPLKKLYTLVTRLSRHRLHASELGANDFAYCLKGLCRFIHYVSQIAPPDELQVHYAGLKDTAAEIYAEREKKSDAFSSNVPFLQLVSIEKSAVLYENIGGDEAIQRPYYELLALNDNHEQVTVRIVGGEWTYLYPLIWKYACLNFVHMQERHDKLTDNAHYYQTTSETLIVLEPDCLYDASVIAECRMRKQETPMWHVCKRFSTTETNYFFLRGALVNDYLDHILTKKQVKAAEIFNRLLQRNPTYSLIIDEEDRQKMLEEVKGHFLILQNKFIKDYESLNLNIEPTFVSEIYGLRGRLDVMVSYPEQPDRRDVIELKTSKDPQKTEFKLISDKDLLQATCYNLLLDSTYEGRTGTSAILYSAADLNANPLRNAPNDIYTKQRFMTLRNRLAWVDYELCRNPERILKNIHLSSFKNMGLWSNQETEIARFTELINTATDYERAYFYEFVRFVACEQRAARIGAKSERNTGGFAGLWNNTPEEKEREYMLLAYLSYTETKDGEFGKDVYFRKDPEKTANIVAFRVGDFVLLYPQEPDGTLRPTKHQIVKVSIKEIGKHHVVINPINPYLTDSFFEKHSCWAIESEINESGFDSMLVSLKNFLALPTYKKQLLLGQRAPEFDDIEPYFAPQLKPQQNLVLNRALAARDYFLLQGPPGTGKTKVMLKTLIERLLLDPKERVILLAYTNRAVDEMCEALSIIDPKILFFRLGHNTTTEYKQNLLSEYAQGEQSIPKIRNKIVECRVFVSTVITWQRNVELSNRVPFTTAIIDEASQLLEPQIIGILGQVKRFILIGDEKQLPAVVTQGDENITPKNELLLELGIQNLCNSLFERLLLNCQQKGWNGAYGMLSDQGRMHQVIEAFPNKHYYAGLLSPISPWQTEEYSELHELPNVDSEDDINYKWLPILQQNRLVYVQTPTENRKNTNVYEATIASQIAQELAIFYGDTLTAENIGIITPYRSQIAEIKRQLSDELVEVISIDTVERYQGSQRRVIIISLAVNHLHQLRKLHVLNHDGTVDKKLNVALTRARNHLIVIGNNDILQQSPIYKVLIDHIAQNGVVLAYDKIVGENDA